MVERDRAGLVGMCAGLGDAYGNVRLDGRAWQNGDVAARHLESRIVTVAFV